MKLTLEKLRSLNACKTGITWYIQNNQPPTVEETIHLLDRQDWKVWLITRLLNKKHNVQFAIYSAEMVLDIFEKIYPNDKRPRQAIEAARNWLINPSSKVATAGAAGAEAAARAAGAWAAAARAAGAWAAAEAAWAAAEAAWAADIEKKIIIYGLSLLDIEA